MIAVRLENVTKRFGATAALDGVSLAVAPGEMFFVLGPSGGGKTTLLRCLSGLCAPEEGRIFFGEEEVTRVEPSLRQAGTVFQNYALLPHLDVAGNVGFGLLQQRRPREEVMQRVRESLAAVRLADYETARVQQLSSGQQQRVALARALVMRPRCLLLDEPLSNLDAVLRQEMHGEIRRISREFGLTTIYVTHDRKEALSMADRIAVLAAGKVRQVGTPREIYKRPGDGFVAEFIGETNFLEGELTHAGAGEAWVRTAAGNFQGALANPSILPEPGAKVRLSIRPESLRLLEEPVEENTLAGSVGHATYFGDVAHYEFEARAPDGSPLSPPVRLRISELNPRLQLGLQRKTLFAYADPDDVVIFA
jgi:iron(III) transport system ATP-binding protein